MRYSVLVLAFLALPAALWAQDLPPLRLDPFVAPQDPQEECDKPLEEAERRQGQEFEEEGEETAPAESGEYAPAMEFLYWNSRIEGGLLLTRFDKDLDIETDPGAYVRYLLRLTDFWTFTVTYRHYSFENSDLPGSEHEDVLLRALMAGMGGRAAFTDEFGLEGYASAGAMWWVSQHAGQDDDSGLLLSGEAAFTVRLHEMVRFKIGVAGDLAWTDFHQDSSESVTGLSGFLGIEIGG